MEEPQQSTPQTDATRTDRAAADGAAQEPHEPQEPQPEPEPEPGAVGLPALSQWLQALGAADAEPTVRDNGFDTGAALHVCASHVYTLHDS